MANTYTSLYYHIVFSTKERRPWIGAEIEQRVWEYLGGIARQHEFKAMQAGGIEDHVHVVLGIPPAISVSTSQLPDVVKYVSSQREHHRQRTFQEEFRAMLKRHGIEYEERFVWG